MVGKSTRKEKKRKDAEDKKLDSDRDIEEIKPELGQNWMASK